MGKCCVLASLNSRSPVGPAWYLESNTESIFVIFDVRVVEVRMAAGCVVGCTSGTGGRRAGVSSSTPQHQPELP